MPRSVLLSLFAIAISLTAYSGTNAEDLSICKSAWLQCELGNYDKALMLFERGIAEGDLSEASLAQTYRNMGITCSRAQKYKQAIEFYDKALNLKPTEPWKDIVNKANAFSNLQKFDEALKLYDKAQELKSNYNEAYFNRGIAFEKQNKLELAVEQFKKAYEHGLRSPGLRERFVTYKLMGSVPPVPAPDGYSWANFAAIKALFLRPEGWHVEKRAPNTYFITKDQLQRNDEFQTGLRIEVLVEVAKKSPEFSSTSTKAIAEKKIKQRTQKHEVTKEWTKKMGPFDAIGIVYQHKTGQVSQTTHNLIIANSKTGTIYDFSFLGPTDKWKESWKVGEPMLQMLFIDDQL